VEPIYPNPEFFIPGTFDTEPPNVEGNPVNLHQGGLDQIAPASDPITELTGAIGYDPYDLLYPSADTQLTVEKKSLPQWGPPFIAFVDDRITELERIMTNELKKWQFQTVTFCKAVSLQTDSSGNINNGILFECPVGFTFALHRISIKPSGSNFGTPFTTAGYFEIRVNTDMVDGSQIGTSPLPSYPIVKTWGTRDAIRVRDGEILSLFMVTGPTSSQITVHLQASFDRTTEG